MKLGIIYGLTALTLATTANATGIFSDIKYKVNDDQTAETRQRLNLDLPLGLEIKAFADTDYDSEGSVTEKTAGGWIAKGTRLDHDSSLTIDNKTYLKIKQNVADTKKNSVIVGTDFNFATPTFNAYVLPVWSEIADNEVQNNFMMGIATQKIGTGSLESGVIYEWNKHSDDNKGAYVIAKTEKLGVSMSEYVYDPIVSVAAGWQNENVGFMGWTEHNYDNKDFKLTAFAAQHPASVVGKEGMNTLANVFCITQPPELDPYLTSTGRKSLDGLAGKLVIEKVSDAWNITPEVAYNAGDLAIMMGSVLKDGEYDAMTAAVNYSKGPVMVEVKGDTHKNFTLYTKVTGTF